MILIAQDGFKAFNMAYIKSYFIYENDVGNFPKLPTKTEKNQGYTIWVAPNLYGNEENLYSIGRFKKLEDAQNVFRKLTSITNPGAEGCIIIKDNDAEIFGADFPIWTR